MQRRYRVIAATPGLDGGDQGARALREAGFEVICTGLHQPDQIAEAVLEEDADAVGVSTPPGAATTWLPEIVDRLDAGGAGDVLVFGVGAIAETDIPQLEAMGVARAFGPDVPLTTTTGWLEDALDRRESDQRREASLS